MPRLHKPNVPIIAPAARARTLTVQTAQRAKKAKFELLVVIPLLAATVLVYLRREELFGVDTPVRVGAAITMVVLGWALARDVGRSAAPYLFRRMDPATAGTVSFLTAWCSSRWPPCSRCGWRAWTRPRWRSAAPSPRSSSASPPSRRWAT